MDATAPNTCNQSHEPVPPNWVEDNDRDDYRTVYYLVDSNVDAHAWKDDHGHWKVKFAIDAGAPYVSADLGRAESANEALDRAHHEIELARQTVALRSDVREAYETWQADIHDVELSLDYFDKLDRLDHNPAERGLERGEYIDEELPLRELEDRMTPRWPWSRSEEKTYVLEIDNPNGNGKLYMSREGMETTQFPPGTPWTKPLSRTSAVPGSSLSESRRSRPDFARSQTTKLGAATISRT
jgi:hypothetical protein